MASGVSKNSKKGSKPTTVFKEKRVKPKKEYILIEVDSKVFSKIKEQEDLSVFQGKPVESIIERFGKIYLKVKNI